MNFRHLTLLILLISGALLIHCSSEPTPDVEKPDINMEGLTIEEGDSDKDIFLTLTMSGPVGDTVIVFVSTVDGTATGGEDFEILETFPVLFTPGDMRVELQITILGELDFEEDEEFQLSLFGATGADLLVEAVTIVLTNDDIDTSLSIPATGYTTPESYEGMTLLWQDEFSGDALGSDWTAELGGGGWGNNELQYYRKENTSLVEGNLVIEARKESFGGRSYTSSRLITKGKFDFTYGRVDVRAALPYGQGIWPAIWMLGANISQVGWPSCGEIDIMEMIGGSNRERTTHGTLHWSNASGQHAYQGGSYNLSSGIFADEFHVFTMIWDSDKVEWYVDDVYFHTQGTADATMAEFDLPHFLILNVAVGGNWPGSPNDATVFPQRMIVDYVRVFQNN